MKKEKRFASLVWVASEPGEHSEPRGSTGPWQGCMDLRPLEPGSKPTAAAGGGFLHKSPWFAEIAAGACVWRTHVGKRTHVGMGKFLCAVTPRASSFHYNFPKFLNLS